MTLKKLLLIAPLPWILLVAQCDQHPDLAILKKEGAPASSNAYCILQNGKLVVGVKNNSSGKASASATKISFITLPGGKPQVFIKKAPPVKPGGIYLHSPIDFGSLRANCFVPHCYFSIETDVMQTVKESDETNNKVTGFCTRFQM